MQQGLSCREFVELVTDYLEGELPAGDRQRFEQHLACCSGCERYLEQFRETVEIAGSIEEEALTEPARSTLLDAFRGWRRG